MYNTEFIILASFKVLLRQTSIYISFSYLEYDLKHLSNNFFLYIVHNTQLKYNPPLTLITYI